MNTAQSTNRLQGVLGMNHRNRHLVDALNPKKWIAVANDKIKCKQLLEQHKIATPETYGVIRYHEELEPLLERLVQEAQPFVVKPAQSARGRGVLICSFAQEERVVMHDGGSMPRREFTFYLRRILHGEYSFGRPLDAVLIEQRIRPDKSWIFNDLPGAPDLRIIVKEGVPVMAMARVPTLRSQGRANLHCGAIGVGIDLKSGLTTHGVWKDHPVIRHPDSAQLLEGRAVTDFEQCLDLARRCYGAVPLGYMGVDILNDANLGPMVIEVNARPGLGVQIANRKGLIEEFLEIENETF